MVACGSSIKKMLLVISAITCGFLFFLFRVWSKKEPKTPPGMNPLPYIKGLPIIGIVHQIKPTLCVFLKKLGTTYGPIFKVNLGMRPILVINDFNIMKKAMKDNADIFAGRPQLEGIQEMSLRSGVVFMDGSLWEKHRWFMLKVLRDFKSKYADIVEKECLYLLDELKTLKGKSVDFSVIIPVYIANIISKFLMNKRFEREDPKLKVIEDSVNSLSRRENPFVFLHFCFPILDGVGWLMRQTELKTLQPSYEVFDEEIQEHLKHLDLISEGEDFMDRFLIEQRRIREKTGTVETFTNPQLIRGSWEMFGAGYETASTTLGWSLMFMSKYPHIQDLVYQEIQDHIGQERLPNVNDRKSLNYTQAVLDEILRMASTAPLAVQHRVVNDCEINGYFIPKDLIIIPNLYACHFDENVWEKPNEFYPEHFLIKDENGCWKYNAREELIPFGLGKRQCLGESLARMEYFVFFTSIIQRFQVRFKKELTDEQYEKIILSNDGLVRTCGVKDFIFKFR